MNNLMNYTIVKLMALTAVSFLVQPLNSTAVSSQTESDLYRPYNSNQLHTSIIKIIPAWCKKTDACAELVVIDCQSSTDGPLYYFNNRSGKLLMKCGGYCLRPKDYIKQELECEKCPPPDWQNCMQSK